MPFRDVKRHFADVLAAIDKISEFLSEMDFDAYCSDDRTKSAVERKLQIITEAVIRLEDDAQGAFPEIDHKGYRGMGNILRHSYHRIDDLTVWSTVKEDLPLLRATVERLLSGSRNL